MKSIFSWCVKETIKIAEEVSEDIAEEVVKAVKGKRK